MAVLFIPAAFAVVALVLLYGLTGGSFHAVAVRATVTVALGLGITASKIASTFAYSFGSNSSPGIFNFLPGSQFKGKIKDRRMKDLSGSHLGSQGPVMVKIADQLRRRKKLLNVTPARNHSKPNANE